jgi:methyltransferase-like protein
MLHGAAGGMLDLRANWPNFTTEVSEKPTVSPLVRAQIGASGVVSNLRHEPVKVNDLERFVLVRADGTQSVDDLVQAVLTGVSTGTLSMTINGQDVMLSDNFPKTIRESVSAALQGGARSSLLVG